MSLTQNRVICLMNNKGGVGKTTLSFNIAKNFIRNGRNVVCVDYDQQSQLQTLLPEITRSNVGAEDLKDISCDYVVVDTGPTFSLEHLDLMDVADLILIPVQLESLDIQQSIKLLKTIKRSEHNTKARIVVIHSGKHTMLYKNLWPALVNFSQEFEIPILAEMRKSQAVAQALLQNKTIFEINSPPEVRNEFKALFKELGRVISEISPIQKDSVSNMVGEECQAH